MATWQCAALREAFGIGADRPHSTQLYLRTRFILFSYPLPPGGPGKGPDCPFPSEIGGFGPIPAQVRGENLFLIFILALSAAGSIGGKGPGRGPARFASIFSPVDQS